MSVDIFSRVSQIIVEIGYFVNDAHTVGDTKCELIIEFFQLDEISLQIIKVKLLLADIFFILCIVLNLKSPCSRIEVLN